MYNVEYQNIANNMDEKSLYLGILRFILSLYETAIYRKISITLYAKQTLVRFEDEDLYTMSMFAACLLFCI